MSRKERFLRKKYMGLCRRESRMVTRMRTPLPSRVTRYMSKMSTKNVFSSLGWAERPRRMNLTRGKVQLDLAMVHLLCHLQELRSTSASSDSAVAGLLVRNALSAEQKENSFNNGWSLCDSQ